MAWLGTWAYRIEIRIPASLIDAALTDFPVLLKLSASSGTSAEDVSKVFDELASDANRKKIAVTTSDEVTQCYVEIEKWDDASELAWLHVKVPSISSSADTTIYLYYDSTEADNTTYVGDIGDAAAQAVWDGYFEFVCHLAQAADLEQKDSTSNAHHFTSSGFVGGEEGAAKIGDGVEFIDDTDFFYVTAGYEPYTDTEFTLEAWGNPDSLRVTGYNTVAISKNGNNSLIILWAYDQDIQAAAVINGSFRTITDTGGLSTSTWQYLAGRWKAGESLDVIQDLNITAGSVYTGALSRSGDDWNIGRWVDVATRDWDGWLDEVRYSSIKRSDAWLKASYYSGGDALVEFQGSVGDVEDDFGIADSVDAEAEYNVSISDNFGISDEVDAVEGWGIVEDGFGIADEVDGWLDTGHSEDNFGIADEVEAEAEYYPAVSDEFGIADETDAVLDAGYTEDEFGISDEVTAGYEYQSDIADNLGIADEVDAFNWTRWLLLNKDRAIARFFFILTGAPDATTDIEIPISSFQARKRTGESTFLSVVVPNLADWAAYITARSNGQLVIDMAFELDGVISIREEILRVNLETIRTDKGAGSRSATLSGHRTETFIEKVVTIAAPVYKAVTSGQMLYRFAIPDPYLNPGDTCRVADDEFRADLVNYVISDAYKTMEVYEA